MDRGVETSEPSSKGGHVAESAQGLTEGGTVTRQMKGKSLRSAGESWIAGAIRLQQREKLQKKKRERSFTISEGEILFRGSRIQNEEVKKNDHMREGPVSVLERRKGGERASLLPEEKIYYSRRKRGRNRRKHRGRTYRKRRDESFYGRQRGVKAENNNRIG